MRFFLIYALSPHLMTFYEHKAVHKFTPTISRLGVGSSGILIHFTDGVWALLVRIINEIIYRLGHDKNVLLRLVETVFIPSLQPSKNLKRWWSARFLKWFSRQTFNIGGNVLRVWKLRKSAANISLRARSDFGEEDATVLLPSRILYELTKWGAYTKRIISFR